MHKPMDFLSDLNLNTSKGLDTIGDVHLDTIVKGNICIPLNHFLLTL